MKKQASNLVILAIFSSAIFGVSAFAQTTQPTTDTPTVTDKSQPAPMVKKDCPVFKDGKMPPPPHDGMKPPPPPKEKKGLFEGLFGKKKPPKPPEFKEGKMPPPPPEGCAPPPPPADGTTPPSPPEEPPKTQ